MAETIKSMTGYGRREATWSGGALVVEARAVNHRFCEVVIRVPRSLSSLEEELKGLVQHRCARGRIEVSVSTGMGKDAGKTLVLDRVMARQYHSLLRDLQRDLGLGGSVDIALLAGFRDIISTSDRQIDEARLGQRVKRLVTGALSELDGMRRREGSALVRDVRARLKIVHEEIAQIESRMPIVVQERFDRMSARVRKLVGSAELEQGRLQQELAMFADRADVSEEVTRLGSHLDQFAASLNSREPVGRTLDFLLQEMGREINTIGSKANDTEMAGHVVRLKGEMERIREQVQNIE